MRTHNLVTGLVTEQERLHVEVWDRVQINLERLRNKRGEALPNVPIGEYVMAAQAARRRS